MKRYVGTGKSHSFPKGFVVKPPNAHNVFYGIDGRAFYDVGGDFMDWMARVGYLAEAKERILENE